MKKAWGYVLAGLVCAIILGSTNPAFAKDQNCEKLLQTSSQSSRGPASIKTPRRVKLMSYNMLELNIEASEKGVRNHRTKGSKQKGLHQKLPWALNQQIQIIKENDPDVLVAEEVANASDLQYLADQLGGQYRVYFERGNDSRGFDIGMLVKTTVLEDFDIEYRSHKGQLFFDEVTKQQTQIFSRDAPTLILKDKVTGQGTLAVIGNHAKSKRNRDGDNESTYLRSQQMVALGEIAKKLEDEFGADFPVFIAGDFNTDVHDSPETSELLRIMTDVFDLLARPPPREERITHSFHPFGGSTQYAQLDAILVNNSQRVRVLSAQVIRYKDQKGNLRRLPRSYKERAEQPSDHFAVISEVEVH